MAKPTHGGKRKGSGRKPEGKKRYLVTLTEKTVTLAFYKTLPLFFDLEGGMEYSYKRGDLLGARLALNFASKPRSCWGLTFTFGQDDLKRKFMKFLFRIDFGAAGNPLGAQPI